MIPDARQNAAMQYIFGMGGRLLWQKSCDAGQRWMLADVGGAPLRAWDERGHTKRATSLAWGPGGAILGDVRV